MKAPEIIPWDLWESDDDGKDFLEQARAQQLKFHLTFFGSLALAERLGLTDDPEFAAALANTIVSHHPALLS